MRLEDVWRELRAIRVALTGPWRFVFTAVYGDNTIERDVKMLVLSSVQQVELSIRPVDAKGNPAPIDGTPSWAVSDPLIGSLVESADGMSAKFVAVGQAGLCQVNVSADADLGEGVQRITGVLDVEVVPAQAVSLEVQAGAPTIQ